MYVVSNPDHDSIFGTTICGVPNPLTPHMHPYPTRYHGPWFGVPSQEATFRVNPYQNPVYAGPGLSGCVPCGMGADALEKNSTRLAVVAVLGAMVGAAGAYLRGKPELPAILISSSAALAADLIFNHERYFG